jgi:hypothetical protein
VKDSFYEERERVLDKSLKYSRYILLGYLKARICGEDLFKPTIWNESLNEISNDN